MKKIILFTLFLCLHFLSKSQQKIDFDTTVLCTNDQMLYSSRFIKINSEKDKYLIGAFKGSCSYGGITINTISNLPTDLSRGIFILKVDSLGNFKWLKKIVESDSLRNFFADIDINGNIVIGLEYRTTLYKFNDTILNKGYLDFIVIKIDSLGNEKFSKTVAGNCFEGINAIKSFNNNIYLTGNFGVDLVGNPNSCPTYFDTILLNSINYTYLAKMDSNGNFLWVKDYSSIIDQLFIENNIIYCVGRSVPLNSIFGGFQLNYPINFISRCFVAKLDTNGNCIWAKKFGSDDNQSSGIFSTSIVKNKSKIYFTGHAFSNYQNSFLFEGGPTLTGTDQTDFFIACYDTLGNFKWNTISNSPGSEYLTQLTTDTVGNVYGVGKFNYTLKFPSDTLYSNGGDDALVCSYDSNGVYRWAISGGGSGGESGNGIASNAQGKLYIVGGTTSSTCYMGNDTLYPSGGISTLYYASIDSIPKLTPLSVKDYTNLQHLNLSIIPNPANDNVTFNIDASNVLGNENTLSIRSIYGETIQTWNLHTSTIQYNTAHLPSGIYIATLQNNKQTNTFKFSIQH